jgi:hypothetical protein
MEGPVMAVGGGCVAVFVGSNVAVDVGASGVDVAVPVGAGVPVGNGEGTKNVEVGNGVKVEKLNKEVGVACVAAVGNMFGLGTGVDGLRDRAENTLIRTEQRQQDISKARPGKSILLSCPCWL